MTEHREAPPAAASSAADAAPFGGLRLAVTFLTRVPVHPRRAVRAPDLPSAVPWFPIVGMLVGLVVGGAYAGGAQLWPRPLAATIAVTIGIVVTGAFHDDGLADMVDAFGGGYTRDDVLRILKDSRHGTFGVSALVVVMAVRVTSISSLGPRDALFAIVAAHALGRAGAVALMGLAPLGAANGLGASYASELRRSQVIRGAVAGLAISIAALAVWGLVAAAFVAIAAALVAWLARRKVGGVTGDVLGALAIIGELLTLLVASAVIHRHGPTLGWWPHRS